MTDSPMRARPSKFGRPSPTQDRQMEGHGRLTMPLHLVWRSKHMQMYALTLYQPVGEDDLWNQGALCNLRGHEQNAAAPGLSSKGAAEQPMLGIVAAEHGAHKQGKDGGELTQLRPEHAGFLSSPQEGFKPKTHNYRPDMPIEALKRVCLWGVSVAVPSLNTVCSRSNPHLSAG